MAFFRSSRPVRYHLLPVLAALLLSACGTGDGDPMVDAQNAYADHDYRAARIHLMTALKEDSADAPANLLYGKTMLRLGDGVAAQAAFQKLSGAPQYQGELPPLMAHALLLRGMPEKALALVDQPSVEHAQIGYWVKARALLDLDREEDALGAIARGLEAVPNDPGLLALRGTYEINARNISAAKKSSAQALRSAPDNLDALLLAGQLALMQQDMKGAKSWYTKALDLYPDTIVPLFSLAAVNADLGNAKEAKAGLKRVLDLAPGHPMALFLMAKISFNDGNIERAQDLLQGAGDSLDDIPAATLLSGEIAYLKGNHEQAIDLLRRFLSISPGHVQAVTVLGSALSAVGNDAEALALVKPAAQRATATPQLLALASKLAAKLGDASAENFGSRASVGKERDDVALKLTEADRAIDRKQWKKAAAIYGDLRASGLSGNAIVMNNSALVQLELGNAAQAVEFARAATALTPGDPHVMDTLGWTLLKSGQDKAEALSLLRQASGKAPGNIEIRWHLANALAANGQSAEAKRVITSLKAFASKDQKAQIEKLLATL